MDLNDYYIIIPSLDPDEKLNKVVDGMFAAGFEKMVLVDDGSDADHKAPFERALAAHPEIEKLVHPVNKGKGRALRDAFAYVAEQHPDCKGVITIDGDGQHTPEDALKLAEGMEQEPDKVMIGGRDFSLSHVPKRSMMGNRITSWVFLVFYGIKLSDTQTGLRGIPAGCLKAFAEDVEGERFEYETNMLLYMHDQGIKFREIPIATVYIEENKSSHFNPLKDSWRIYKLIFSKSRILKQFISSVISTAVDLSLFSIFNKALEGPVAAGSMSTAAQIFLAVGGARIISALLNYTINRNWVFRSNAAVGSSLVRYAVVAVCQYFLSSGTLNLLVSLTGASGGFRTLLKAVVDVILFVLSYFVQKKFVFGSRR